MKDVFYVCNCFPKKEKGKILLIILRRQGTARGKRDKGKVDLSPNLQTYIAQFILLRGFQSKFLYIW